MGLVKLDHLLEGEVADDVRFEHEKGLLPRTHTHTCTGRERQKREEEKREGESLLGRIEGDVRKHTNKSPLLGVGLVKLDHLLEGEVADDVRVEHEEGLLVRCEHVAGEREGACGAQGLGLLGDVDLHPKLCACECGWVGMWAGEGLAKTCVCCECVCVLADDVLVQHEEGLLVRCEHVAGERERTRSAQGLGLLGDVDIQSKLCGGCACVGMGMCAGE